MLKFIRDICGDRMHREEKRCEAEVKGIGV